MIDSVRNSVLALLNKHNYGSIPVADFNEYAKMSQMDIFLGLFENYKDVINMENRRMSGTGEADMRRAIEEAIDIFTVTRTLNRDTDNIFDMPSLATTGSKSYKINEILVYDVNGAIKTFLNTSDYISKSKLEMLKISNLSLPTKVFPAHYIEGTKLTMFPETINVDGAVEAEYVRFPLDPKWTFVSLSGGEPIFNASANDYQDFELPSEYYTKLIFKILQYTGLSIREADVVQYVRAGEAADLMEKNS